MTTPSLLTFKNVTKTFGDLTALDDVSFDVSQGESVALWGSNGAGKTTLIRCLLGVTDFKGDAIVDGLSAKKHGKKVRQKIGYVPQLMPYFDLPVGEMLVLISKLRQVPVEEGVKLLKRFGLEQTHNKLVRSLSGGMRQKLALTLALLGDPQLLVLDEPTANLDAATQKELIGMLNDLKHEGRTLIFTSHRWSEVRALADTVIHLEAGKVIEHDSVHKLAPDLDHVSIRFEFASPHMKPAIESLKSLGFAPFVNSSHISVSVQDKAKMEVFAALTQSGIAPINFEVEVEE